MKHTLQKILLAAIAVAITVTGCNDEETVNVPTVTTAEVTDITASTATAGGTIEDNGGAAVTTSGVCWSKDNEEPTIDDDLAIGTTASGDFESVVTSLQASTTYYLRAYATNSKGTGYGEAVTFTTGSGVGVPSVATAVVTEIEGTSATGGGTIINNGGATITASGLCWSKENETPTNEDAHTTRTTASGSFAETMSILEEETTYYVRAYATNSAGTGYGEVVTFATGVDDTQVTFAYYGDTVTYGIIVSSQTQRKWMDRNLGASAAATSLTDTAGYGHLFQWGRLADGHQLRNSTTITTLATSDVPGNSNFIAGSVDWRNPSNDNLWQGSSGINNPCPTGWHVPTKDEWLAEIPGIPDANGAFNLLKLTSSGYRSASSGALKVVGLQVDYWSSTSIASSSDAYYFYITSSIVDGNSVIQRAIGNAIRCIKDN